MFHPVAFICGVLLIINFCSLSSGKNNTEENLSSATNSSNDYDHDYDGNHVDNGPKNSSNPDIPTDAEWGDIEEIDTSSIEKIISKEEAEEKAREQLVSHGPIHTFNRFGGGANEGEDFRRGTNDKGEKSGDNSSRSKAKKKAKGRAAKSEKKKLERLLAEQFEKLKRRLLGLTSLEKSLQGLEKEADIDKSHDLEKFSKTNDSDISLSIARS